MSVEHAKITILTYPKGNINMATTNWKNYPFNVDGINFNSRVDLNSPTGQRVKNLPEAMFQEMNIGAIRNLIGDVKTMTRDEIYTEISRVNDGSTWAVIELV
jgi:hypothetical protein